MENIRWILMMSLLIAAESVKAQDSPKMEPLEPAQCIKSVSENILSLNIELSCWISWLHATRYYLRAGGLPTADTNEKTFVENKNRVKELLEVFSKWND